MNPIVTVNNAGKFLIIHQNVRSLRKFFDSLVCHLETFECMPDFIFVSEIWIYSCEKNDFSLPGFNFYALCNDSFSSGEVAVFVKNSYNCVVSYFDRSSSDILKIECTIHNVKFTFICVPI